MTPAEPLEGHSFCCGSGEQFVQAASSLVDDEVLADLLPLVETYARGAAQHVHDEMCTVDWDEVFGR